MQSTVDCLFGYNDSQHLLEPLLPCLEFITSPRQSLPVHLLSAAMTLKFVLGNPDVLCLGSPFVSLWRHFFNLMISFSMSNDDCATCCQWHFILWSPPPLHVQACKVTLCILNLFSVTSEERIVEHLSFSTSLTLCWKNAQIYNLIPYFPSCFPSCTLRTLRRDPLRPH